MKLGIPSLAVLSIISTFCKNSILAEKPYVYNGQPAAQGRHPYVVAYHLCGAHELGGPCEFKCGGTLIANNVVVTASDCYFVDDDLEDSATAYVILDAYDLNNMDDARQKRNVAETIIRPNDSSSRNNIMLLVLEEEAPADITPIKVNECSVEELLSAGTGGNPHIVGHGLIGINPIQAAPLLHEGATNVIDPSVCEAEWPFYQIPYAEKFLCAGLSAQNGCGMLDQGAPLFLKGSDELSDVLIGFYYFGFIRCAIDKRYGRQYVNIAYHFDWIQGHIQQQAQGDRSRCSVGPDSLTPETVLASSAPTKVPLADPTDAPVEATYAPSFLPTNIPTVAPTRSPTPAPSAVPTLSPTKTPTPAPSAVPTLSPTKTPTPAPSSLPTVSPSEPPTPLPSAVPTVSPTESPSQGPSASPTFAPTKAPTLAPSALPTVSPTEAPTPLPSVVPSISPTESPTPAPSASPTIQCGDNVCPDGEVCCNESCGICAPPGGYCSPRVCGSSITTPDTATPAPVTPAPVTPAPITPAPITPAPITPAPITPAPITPAPVTPAPTNPASVTPAPQTHDPSLSPTTVEYWRQYLEDVGGDAKEDSSDPNLVIADSPTFLVTPAPTPAPTLISNATDAPVVETTKKTTKSSKKSTKQSSDSEEKTTKSTKSSKKSSRDGNGA